MGIFLHTRILKIVHFTIQKIWMKNIPIRMHGDFSRLHFSRQPCRCPEKVTKMAEKEYANEKCERARGCMLKFPAHAGRTERSVTIQL
eukprot:COSAG05_NODE_874_length_6832_cov_2.914303_1_plen_88_part_00